MFIAGRVGNTVMATVRGSIVTVTIANANMDLEKRVTRVDVDTNDFTSQ